jgi:hypothetical protein
MSATGKVRRLGPYSKPAVLAKLDQRTREARILHDTREALTEHVGGAPSAVQRMLIERAAQLTLKLQQLDAEIAADGLSDHDTRYYICWSNALTRTLAQLKPAAAARGPALPDYLTAKSATA